MKSMVTIEDFNRLDIRIGKVLSVEKVPDAEKLLKFIFDLGEEKRQIIAGMAEFYSEPSILEGKEMPLLLNIEPRTFRGQVSEGMIIAADVDGRPVLLHPEREISPMKYLQVSIETCTWRQKNPANRGFLVTRGLQSKWAPTNC